jgi:hypothetical protein
MFWYQSEDDANRSRIEAKNNLENAYLHLSISVRIFIYMCLYIYTYICIYICIYIYIYKYIFVNIFRYQSEDDANRSRIEAKNNLENVCYQLKSQLADPNIEGRIGDDDKETINDALTSATQWLERNQGIYIYIYI